ncbi:hypothetical protein [Catenulispora pinisilvae]|nr:hypothetical protein [Catenulispora pinisilvae]
MNQLGGSAPTERDQAGTVVRAPADPLGSRSFSRIASSGPEVEP